MEDRKNVYTTVTLQPLTRGDVHDILSTAIEGGIGYWACLCNDTAEWAAAREELKAETGERPTYDEVALRVMDKGQSVVFEDSEYCEGDDEDEDAERWELTSDKFIQGCVQYERENGIGVKRLLDRGGFDAEVADCIIQYALFGEVVYG